MNNILWIFIFVSLFLQTYYMYTLTKSTHDPVIVSMSIVVVALFLIGMILLNIADQLKDIRHNQRDVKKEDNNEK
jgi:UDP-N-acetylmuramyl pentapeptide phosphotransferase/UDP-N-acetylglucosamine-1-phosphate transferase